MNVSILMRLFWGVIMNIVVWIFGRGKGLCSYFGREELLILNDLSWCVHEEFAWVLMCSPIKNVFHERFWHCTKSLEPPLFEKSNTWLRLSKTITQLVFYSKDFTKQKSKLYLSQDSNIIAKSKNRFREVKILLIFYVVVFCLCSFVDLSMQRDF